MIRVLAPEVVNQIAAGEVIERPFSVVKELVENSLDAGAQRVHVEIVEGGRASIRVHDDGAGMSEEDLALAFASHATSKLSDAEDLQHIASFGFRGEALASIGSVARARIASRPAAQASGFEVACAGGAIQRVRPVGCPPGTTVEVADLFFNTPARRRFLRTPQAEKARIQDLLVRLALAHAEVDFTLRSDGRESLRLPAGEDPRARIARAFGRTVADALHAIATPRGDTYIEGWIGDPDAARRDAKLELLWVNGRLVRDRAAAMAVREAYRPFLISRLFPLYFLHLVLPPGEVDVNVHPTKAEVRFRDARAVCGMLYDAVRKALAARKGGSATLRVARELPAAMSGFPDLPAGLFGRAVVSAAAVRERAPEPAREPTQDPEPAHPFRAMAACRFLQVSNLYIVLEAENGLMVVDQHALHERILYEKMTRRAPQGVSVQRLLVPEILELSAADKTYLLEAREALAEVGFLLSDFGGNAVAVQGIPALLARARPAALVESFLAESDGEPRPRADAAIHERFHSRACRSAVMAGDALSDQEIAALLADAAQLEHPHNCPHGRPTVLTFTRAELEKFFGRH
jgi:DNA mismatch repair protein MutL